MNGVSVVRRLLVVVLLATACTNAAVTETVAPTSTTSTTSTSTTTTTTTTTVPLIQVDLTVGATERLALGGGVSIRAELGDSIVELTHAEPTGRLVVDSPGPVRFTYMAGDAATDVTWTAEVTGPGTIVVSQPWRVDAQPPSPPVALVWQALGDTAAYLAQLDRTRNVTVTSPVCMFVGSTGNLTNSCSRSFVEAAQDRGYEVWPAIAGLDADANAIWLNDPETRSAGAIEIAGWIADLGADGINLDIEGYREDTADSFVAFVEELAPLIHDGNGVLSIDLIPRTDDWVVTPEELSFWSTAPRRRKLAELADYMVLMAYDEHNRFRPAGPVASPEWVEGNLRYLLRYADPHEIVLGVPFYGRIWDPDQLDRPRAVGLGRLVEMAAEGQVTFDPETGLDRVELGDGRYLWLETPEGLRFDLIDEYGLAGWAAWRLGFDSAAIWEAVPPI